MATDVVWFDKENNQIEHKVMARGVENNKLLIGWVVIEKPWYSNSNDWTHYIYSNEYGSGGFCGGATDLGLKREIVDPDTIETYNQIASIKWNKEHNLDTMLVKESSCCYNEKPDDIIAIIGVKDEIPYELWDNK